MEKKNREIRQAAKENSVYLWEIAKALGISEPTITRWLRSELSKEKESKILFTIRQIAREKEAAL